MLIEKQARMRSLLHCSTEQTFSAVKFEVWPNPAPVPNPTVTGHVAVTICVPVFFQAHKPPYLPGGLRYYCKTCELETSLELVRQCHCGHGNLLRLTLLTLCVGWEM